MDLPFIFLAESAITHEGTFFAHGGGVSYLRSPVFPCSMSTITLVAAIRVYPNEFEAPHTIRVRGIAPDGSSVFADQTIPFSATPIAGRPKLPGNHILALTFKQLVLPVAGSYEFVLSVDDVDLGSVAFFCDVDGPASESQNPRASKE
jgi:hypothetical protein